MSISIPSLSLFDQLRLNATHFIPYVSRGVITEKPTQVSFWARHQSDPGGVALIGAMREKYASEYLQVRVLTGPALLVLAPGGIRRILDASPDTYGSGAQKVKRMSHFQLQSVTVSQGQEWRIRRAFNCAVLDAAVQPQPCGDRFVQVIGAAVDERFGTPGAAQLTWSDFERLFETIMLQVVFGDASGERRALARAR